MPKEQTAPSRSETVRRLLARFRPGRRAAVVVGVLVLGRVVLGLTPHPPLRTRIALSRAVTAADGTLLRLTLADDGQYRMWTPLDQISPLLVEATLRYEDRHFYRHLGVNPLSLGRAAVATYVTGGRRVGGSTLTMQLARRLWSLSSRTPLGKVQQIARALQLEAQYSKREILEAYLNLAPYGGNIEGAGAASAIYFRKPAAKLTLGEALTLAVVPQSPVRRAGGAGELDRARNELLRAFVAAHPRAPAEETSVRDWPSLRGKAPADSSPDADATSPASLPSSLPFLAPHFVDQVLESEGDGTPGGTIPTSLDAHLQRLCERHLHAYIARERHRGIANAAALLVDVRDMGIRALVGSADFFDDTIAGQVNGALAPRSPGSTLKPLVYALGLDQGVIHPATMLRDVPTAYAAYSPENFDGRFVGPLSAKDALIRSRNVPALSVAARLSRPTLYDLLKTAGVSLPFAENHYGLGLALGTGEVTMEDLVRLYAALGNGGVVRPLAWRAATKGSRASANEAAGVRIVSEESAFLVVDMLLDNPPPVNRHTPLSSAHRVPVAWKTGTSWGFRDAWAVGLFGHYVLAIWAGDFSGAGNPALVGADAAAPLFFQIVDSIAAEDPSVSSFPHTPPRGVRRIEVCALSGGLPTSHCPHTRTSWFIPGRSPIAPCEIHRTITLDAQGRRTCPAGPPTTSSEVFEVWSSDLAKQFVAAGLPRRALPPLAPGCDESEAGRGSPPRIVSPLAGVTYSLRPASGANAGATLALQAVTGGDASELFWFADRNFLGKVGRGETLFWKPPGGGHFTVRAVDDLGRSDARQVATDLGPSR